MVEAEIRGRKREGRYLGTAPVGQPIARQGASPHPGRSGQFAQVASYETASLGLASASDTVVEPGFRRSAASAAEDNRGFVVPGEEEPASGSSIRPDVENAALESPPTARPGLPKSSSAASTPLDIEALDEAVDPNEPETQPEKPPASMSLEEKLAVAEATRQAALQRGTALADTPTSATGQQPAEDQIKEAPDRYRPQVVAFSARQAADDTLHPEATFISFTGPSNAYYDWMDKQRGGQTVVLVTPNARQAATLGDELGSDAGLKIVAIASSPEEAAALIQEHRPDIVFTSLEFPEGKMSGLAFVNELLGAKAASPTADFPAQDESTVSQAMVQEAVGEKDVLPDKEPEPMPSDNIPVELMSVNQALNDASDASLGSAANLENLRAAVRRVNNLAFQFTPDELARHDSFGLLPGIRQRLSGLGTFMTSDERRQMAEAGFLKPETPEKAGSPTWTPRVVICTAHDIKDRVEAAGAEFVSADSKELEDLLLSLGKRTSRDEPLRRVVVIEPNPTGINSLTKRLADYPGVNITSFTTIEEALPHICEARPDAVLSEHVLPHGDLTGTDLMDRLNPPIDNSEAQLPAAARPELTPKQKLGKIVARAILDSTEKLKGSVLIPSHGEPVADVTLRGVADFLGREKSVPDYWAKKGLVSPGRVGGIYHFSLSDLMRTVLIDALVTEGATRGGDFTLVRQTLVEDPQLTDPDNLKLIQEHLKVLAARRQEREEKKSSK